MRTPATARRRLIAGVAALIAVALVGVASIAASRSTPAREQRVGADVRAVLARDLDSLDDALAELSRSLAAEIHGASDTASVRAAFRKSRTRYKHVEAIAEFYSPALAAALNSRRQEVDDDDQPPPSTLAPSGFPALERMLWPVAVADSAERARAIVDGMRATMQRMRWLDAGLAVTDPQLIEVARLELVRIETLGIAGFDAQVTHSALRESADALDALRQLFAAAGPRRWPTLVTERLALDRALDSASGYLRAHDDFVSSDRLTLLVKYLEPAGRALHATRDAAHIEPLTMPRPLRADAESPYAAGAFDARAYAPSGAAAPTREILTLGERLFSERSLSRGGVQSCASCHVPTDGFTDGVVTAASIDAHGAQVTRNTPTLVNAALQQMQFADERAASLEAQVSEVLSSPAEMGSSAERAADALAADSSYRVEFERAFGVAAERAVTPLRLRQALAVYVRSLVALDSRFDRAVRGDTAALTTEERRGFTLFMGKAGCGTCHFAPLFSGNTPPLYRSSDVEVIGTPRSPARPSTLDADSGRARIDHLSNHLRAFKTPTLRNIALTAPYMHNGAFRTLEQVVDFYDAGGALGAGAKISDQTLAPDSLHLSAVERRSLIAFLRALTDTSYAKKR